MRQVLSLSFPEKITEEIKNLSKKRGFVSVSGYIKYLIEADQDLISASTLWRSVQKARKEYKMGKTIKAKTLADL